MADKHVTQEVAKEGTQAAADMLNNEPEQVAQDDTVMVQTAERYALEQRLSSGSIAAQAQPIGDAPENLQKVGEVAQKKLDENPASLTTKDSKQDLSAEHMVLGHIPPKDSISASVQRTAAANDSSTKGNVSKETLPVIRARRQSVSAADQSHIAREKKYEHAAQVMKQKLENHPEDITKEDANHLRRLDMQAHGATEKGSLTAQAQSEAAKREGEAKKAAGDTEPSDPAQASEQGEATTGDA